MKICAIICEYNPLHNGHRKHIEASRELSRADAVLCLMSGNFVQRGEPALLDKYTRARLAVEAGADAVLELPAVYATASAEGFAQGAVRMLNAMPGVEWLSFGSENGSIEPLTHIAEYLEAEPPAFKKLVTEQLSRGSTLASAKTAALIALARSGDFKSESPEAIAEILSSPNNLLGLEYLKALIATNSKISPLTMSREGSSHNTTELTGAYSSASAIRKAIAAGCLEEVKPSVPDFAYECLRERLSHNRLSLDAYGDLILYRLRSMSAAEIAEIADVTEGLENRLKTYANYATGYASLVDSVKTKRYTHARLRRILLYVLLGITKRKVQRAAKGDLYARVLAIRNGRQDVLAAIKSPKLQLVTRNDDYRQLAGNESAEADLLASDVYALLNSDPQLKMGGQDLVAGLQIVK